ncbi:MAG: NAD(P)H-hydrate dehydratase [Planctomycetaceae bacterium]|nr:NAD(P)H-hydrate dehydratase [Planctomycetaceae bacterium]
MKRITDLPPFPDRPEEGHKGTFGRVLIIAGSRGMSGAAILSGMAALRSGAGLVYLAIPETILDIVASYEPSYLTLPQPSDDEGRFSVEAEPLLRDHAEGMTAAALGPGLGQSDELAAMVELLYQNLELPLVVDADGLNNLADSKALLEKPETPRILTPHPGEFSRLCGLSIGEIQSNREEVAFYFAEKSGTVLVLKGPNTVVTDGDRLFVNQTGNSGLATGGTGDVLTGLISALLAQQMEPFEAACLAVHLHGLAGDLAAAEKTEPGLISSDLPHYLTLAIRQHTS